MDFANDLREQFQTYYQDIIVALPKLLVGIVLVFVLSFILKSIRKKAIAMAHKRADDKLLISFANSIFTIINVIFITLVFLYVIGQGGIATTILGAAGVSAFVIGFALKDIGENFLAGVIMAFDRPFRLGDVIKTGDVEGVILEMSLRDTHIKTFDGKDVYVPNGQIIKIPLYNYTIDGYMRGSFTVRVDYVSDIAKTRAIILAAVNSVPGVLQEGKLARTHVKTLSNSSIDIEVHYWVNTFDQTHSGLDIKSLAQSNTVDALTKANVSIPADVLVVKNYNETFEIDS